MDWQDRIEEKIDRIDEKLDSHLDRLSKAEEAIVWMKGHIKLVTTIGITVVGLLITALIKGGY